MIEQEKLNKISKKLLTGQENYLLVFRKNVFLYVNDKEITLNDISEQSGIPFSTLNSFLYGNSKDVKLSTAVKLAKALNISIDELVGAETINKSTRESFNICRNLPNNDLVLVRWFIRYLADLNNKQSNPQKRYIKIMLPEEDNDGNCKLIPEFENYEIAYLQEPLRSKIFMGFKITNDYYMPYYKQGDIILIANDRPAKFNEHILIRVNNYIFIAKRIFEKNVWKLFSIRDNKYRIDESEIDEIIGYIVKI